MQMKMKMRDEVQVCRCLMDRGCSPLADQVLRAKTPRTRTNLRQLTNSLVVDVLTISG
jgi:hypothetical protein